MRALLCAFAALGLALAQTQQRCYNDVRWLPVLCAPCRPRMRALAAAARRLEACPNHPLLWPPSPHPRRALAPTPPP